MSNDDPSAQPANEPKIVKPTELSKAARLEMMKRQLRERDRQHNH